MINKNLTGVVFDTQSFSVHDGPGIRTLVFLKGCPLSCLWCANPEGQASYPEFRYHIQKCLGCGTCIEVCPHGAVSRIAEPEPGQGFVTFDREKCAKCKDMPCVDACPNKALQQVGKVMTVEEVMKIIKRDRPYYRRVGGITLSGGEPLLQIDFAVELLKACHEEYINTAVETAMHLPWEKLERALPYVDLFLSDIKHMDSDKHKELTGVPNNVILENFTKLAKAKPGAVLIRMPVIPGCNDSVENISATAAFAQKIGITRINLLPYHKLGEVKYHQLGMEYPMDDVPTPTDEHMAELKKAVEDQGVICVVG